MSEYLGWTERRPPVGAKTSLKEDMLPGGPVTQSYENYVKNIFHPMNRSKNDSSQRATDHGLSASRMLKMEQSLGKYALDDSLDTYDDTGLYLKTPLESLYAELGLSKPENALYRQFPVYMPKQSSEYFAISHGAEPRADRYGAPCYSSYREKDDDDYAKNNRKTLIDYKDFDSSPLSPYLYKEHPYVRSQDSRIVGSNFVQLTSRPKDRFLDKIDQTLAEVRAMPRYT
ncbi:hypothetical protein Y032_0634g909 [Ancylostoma ceylanicum]|uniref:Uncharacterized protein n=1 Tax=Ancylostoma ceylanicum TaxID=53326 RepID=A0A016WK09_9BILA|nr:hypothetical protein Y032_0634g909 [Ancylostoma ceylanicum]